MKYLIHLIRFSDIFDNFSYHPKHLCNLTFVKPNSRIFNQVFGAPRHTFEHD